ncbi:MAG: dihydropteroate synthase, partial [Deltaproteobacteria bacterium]|nr:dihydropteroate synthase [Deltaproteobacteria bacterium]
QVLALARRFDTTLVALVMDESGISPTVDGRVKACEKIADACRRHEVPLDRVYFDPLVLPVSADVGQGLVTLATISEIKRRYPESKTIMGLSNISYGLPARQRLNSAFLHMAVYAGLDAAIANPMNEELMAAVKTAEVLVGRDRHCRRYVKAFRVPTKPPS